MHDLAGRMHAGIGAPGADGVDARVRDERQRRLERLLHRVVADFPGLGEALPAEEVAAVVFDAEAMHAAAQALVGEHDFSAFRTVHCQAPHARRDLQAITVARSGDEVTVEVRANAFLHHMVRNIVGSLLLVGRGEKPGEWIAQVLAGRDRTVAGPTAPGTGLVFLGPLYPARFGLPDEVSA